MCWEKCKIASFGRANSIGCDCISTHLGHGRRPRAPLAPFCVSARRPVPLLFLFCHSFTPFPSLPPSSAVPSQVRSTASMQDPPQIRRAAILSSPPATRQRRSHSDADDSLPRNRMLLLLLLPGSRTRVEDWPGPTRICTPHAISSARVRP